jgi:hypothetical protein
MSEQNQILVEGVSDGVRWTANYIATGWTVDDRGFLHIFGPDTTARNVATYAPAHWGFVSRPIPDGEPNEHEGQANFRVVTQDDPSPCDEHKEVQHRDGNPPWCNACGWRHATPAAPPQRFAS